MASVLLYLFPILKRNKIDQGVLKNYITTKLVFESCGAVDCAHMLSFFLCKYFVMVFFPAAILIFSRPVRHLFLWYILQKQKMQDYYQNIYYYQSYVINSTSLD